MLTVRCSGRLMAGGGGIYLGDVCPGGCLSREGLPGGGGGSALWGCTPLPLWTDTCEKHYLSLTTVVGGKNVPSYHPPTKLWEGIIFTGVCHFVQDWGSHVTITMMHWTSLYTPRQDPLDMGPHCTGTPLPDPVCPPPQAWDIIVQGHPSSHPLPLC